MGKDSAIGFSFRHTKDFDFSKSSAQEDVYNQILLGATHVANENLSFGLLIVDLMQKKKKDSRAFLGAQFMLSDIFALIGDVGAFYQNDLSETLVYRGAIQINFLSDFFVRAGFFEDKGQNEKGNGVGVSWVGPRFSMDLSLKTTKPITNDVPQGNTGSKLSETSMSVSLLF